MPKIKKDELKPIIASSASLSTPSESSKVVSRESDVIVQTSPVATNNQDNPDPIAIIIEEKKTEPLVQKQSVVKKQSIEKNIEQKLNHPLPVQTADANPVKIKSEPTTQFSSVQVQTNADEYKLKSVHDETKSDWKETVREHELQEEAQIKSKFSSLL